MQSVQIDEKYFDSKKKCVRFSDDVKEYDGASSMNNDFAKLCKSYFFPSSINGAVHTSFDVLEYLTEIECEDTQKFLNFAIDEVHALYSKLMVLQDRMFLESFKESIEGVETNQMIEDPYWENPIWDQIKKQRQNKYKVCVARRGNRDFATCIGVNHLYDLKKFYEVLNEASEWYQ